MEAVEANDRRSHMRLISLLGKDPDRNDRTFTVYSNPAWFDGANNAAVRQAFPDFPPFRSIRVLTRLPNQQNEVPAPLGRDDAANPPLGRSRCSGPRSSRCRNRMLLDCAKGLLCR